MNREILFRGKHIHTGEWIFGPSMLFFPDGEVYIYPEDGLDSPDSYQVDPSTLGQYTGLQDKNGKNIFVGDILRFDNGDTVYLEMEDWLEVSVISVGDPELEDQWRDLYRIERAEIIGNIHDNPELL